MQNFNLDAGSYLCQTSAKALAMAEKEKKDKYLQPFLDCMCSFTPMVYYADGITGMEAIAAQQRLDLLLSDNLKQEYLEMCGLVKARMSLEIMRSNTFLLRGAREKEVYIHQIPDLADGAVMSLLMPWQG